MKRMTNDNTTQDLTEQTENPELLEGDGNIDRWTNYGKDRIYLNDFRKVPNTGSAFIDLKNGEVVCEVPNVYSHKAKHDLEMEIKDNVATIRNGNETEIAEVAL